MGVTVSETTMEMAMAMERITANSRNRRPTTPLIMRMGMKTAMSEMLIDRTVKPISSAPLRAACMGFMPLSRWRVMFSMTTIASSTTNPVAMVSAISDRLSRVYPSRYIAPNVATMETGTETLGMNVDQPLRRKMNTTRMTSPMEMTMLRWASLNESRVVMVRSLAILKRTVGGSWASNCGINALIRATVSTMFAFGWRLISICTIGLPLTTPKFR